MPSWPYLYIIERSKIPADCHRLPRWLKARSGALVQNATVPTWWWIPPLVHSTWQTSRIRWPAPSNGPPRKVHSARTSQGTVRKGGRKGRVKKRWWNRVEDPSLICMYWRQKMMAVKLIVMLLILWFRCEFDLFHVIVWCTFKRGVMWRHKQSIILADNHTSDVPDDSARRTCAVSASIWLKWLGVSQTHVGMLLVKNGHKWERENPLWTSMNSGFKVF